MSGTAGPLLGRVAAVLLLALAACGDDATPAPRPEPVDGPPAAAGPVFPVRLLEPERRATLEVLLEDALADLPAWWVLEGEQLVPAADHPAVRRDGAGLRLARAGTTLVRLQARAARSGGTFSARLSAPGDVHPPGLTDLVGVHELREDLLALAPDAPSLGRWLARLLADPERAGGARWTTAADSAGQASAADAFAGQERAGGLALVLTAAADQALVSEARLTARPQVQRRREVALQPGVPREALAAPEQAALRLGVERRDCLLVGPGQSAELSAQVPAGARTLTFGVGPLPGSPVGQASRWSLTGRLDDGPARPLAEGELSPASDLSLLLAFEDHQLPWPADWSAGGRLTLELSVEGAIELGFAQPMVRGAPRGARPNLLLISIDTVRADHLGWHGYERDTTPRMDAFVAGGTAFLNASSAAPFTLPSHASLLTGLLPPRHGAVNGATDALDPTGVPYLPHLLAERGWHTVAWTGGGMMSAQYGFASGFDSFRAFDPVNTHLLEGPLLPPRPPYDAALEQRVEGLQIEALPEVLAGYGDEPWFAFLHTFAAHNYTTPEEDLAAVVPGPHRGWGVAFVQVNEYVRFWRDMGVDAERVARLRDLYDASLHHLDRRLGAFLEELDASGLLDDTLVVLFSDHGEEFAEHGGLMHGNTLYQEMLHVPLVLRGPGLPAGRRVAESVTLTDVLPTVLELLGVPAPADLDGRSLVPLLGDQRRSPGQPPRMVGHVATSRASGMSYRSGRWKLVRMRRVLDDGSTTIRWSLYDLSQDPGETEDLAGRRPDVVERLRQSLEQLERDQAAEGVEGGRALIDPALAEQLQALGYADFVPGEDR